MTLSASEINGLKCPNEKKQIKKYDARGLYLLIKSNNAKLWRFKYIYAGKNKEMALGRYPSITLSKARDAAENARILLGKGIDPMAERKSLKKASTASNSTFEVVALRWLEKHKDSWSEDYARRITRWIKTDANVLAKFEINEIDTGHIAELMLKIEASGNPKKAPMILSVINRIFGFALANRLTRTNPAQGLPLKDIIAPLPKVKSFAAIVNPKELSKLIYDIDNSNGGTFCTTEALKLIPRIFLRPNEIRNLQWEYIDFEEKLIRIPEKEMKKEREHLVPLASQVIEQLKTLKEITGYSPYIFPSQKNSNNPISKNVLTNRLRHLGYGADVMTAHGFRSTASTILHEQGWKHDVIETQLAHLTGTATSRAYNRSIYLAERRKMMQEWADYLEQISANK